MPKGTKNTQGAVFARIKEKHGDTLDLSKAVFTRTKDKMHIICNVCGHTFERSSGSLLSKVSTQGCKVCARQKQTNNQTKTQEQFLKEAREAHDTAYDYSEVVYTHGKTKVAIICPVHGVFHQTPKSHVEGKGCQVCGNEGNRREPEDIIKQAHQKHKHKYTYTRMGYVNDIALVTITCPVHGDFKQNVSAHLRGQGCKKCASDKLAVPGKTTAEFVQQARGIHGDLYDYSKTVYTRKKNPMIIICKKHGEFVQKANDHLAGCGCKKCKNSKGELRIGKYFDEQGVPFVVEKTFPDCKDIRPLRFDVYIPEYDLLIEYQGEFHYSIVKKFQNKEQLLDRQKKDKIKKDYAEKHHNFLEIPHWDFNNIEKILEETLKNLKQ